ncbi:uncharacterized protein [Dermacentor albipictus]|uniref:uncharacterized protein n=1 Tax=Dermacentor albipictus TaxID=60249 RepID=UPI0038FC65EE
MLRATLFVVILCGAVLCRSTGLKGSPVCVKPDCSTHRNRQNMSCTNPCEGYFCKDGRLMTLKCIGADDPLCDTPYGGTGPYPDCCGPVRCSESAGKGGSRRP